MRWLLGPLQSMGLVLTLLSSWFHLWPMRKHFDKRHTKNTARQAGRPANVPNRTAKERAPSQIETVSSNNIIMGRNCLKEVLSYKANIIKKILCSVDVDSADSTANEIMQLAKDADITLEHVRSDDLSEFVGSASHQSFAAVIKDRGFGDLKHFLQSAQGSDSKLVLCIDSISDPQNFGTILRAAECFAVDAVVWSRNRGVGITPVVSKASVGASELVHNLPVANLVDALRKLKEAGFWIVTGSLEPKAQSIVDFEFPAKTVLVVGAEGPGISRLVEEQADYKVSIPLHGRIQSLNVSQATTILLHAYRQRIGIVGHKQLSAD